MKFVDDKKEVDEWKDVELDHPALLKKVKVPTSEEGKFTTRFVPMWTGKQIIGMMLKNMTKLNGHGTKYIDHNSKSQLDSKLWNRNSRDHEKYSKNTSKITTTKDGIKVIPWDSTGDDEKIIIRKSEVLCGVMDKSQFGSKSHGFIHLMHEMYGPRMAGVALSSFARLVTSFLQLFHGFTCAAHDALVDGKANAER